MSRKSGCPFNIRDYAVSIRNPVTEELVRVKGLDSMSVEAEAETGDGKAGDALWSEMFIKSRAVSGSLGGRPIADRITGLRDPGQALMHRAAMVEGGCSNDQTIRVADAIGRAVEYDCVVVKESVEAGEDGEEIQWDWQGVGAPREIPYVQLTSVGFTEGASVNLTPGNDLAVNVSFVPADASNRRFSYYLADEAVAAVHSVEDGQIVLRGVSAGETTLTVRTMNNRLTATLTLRVAAA